jgi:hypothetical protein
MSMALLETLTVDTIASDQGNTWRNRTRHSLNSKYESPFSSERASATYVPSFLQSFTLSPTNYGAYCAGAARWLGAHERHQLAQLPSPRRRHPNPHFHPHRLHGWHRAPRRLSPQRRRQKLSLCEGRLRWTAGVTLERGFCLREGWHVVCDSKCDGEFGVCACDPSR